MLDRLANKIPTQVGNIVSTHYLQPAIQLSARILSVYLPLDSAWTLTAKIHIHYWYHQQYQLPPVLLSLPGRTRSKTETFQCLSMARSVWDREQWTVMIMWILRCGHACLHFLLANLLICNGFSKYVASPSSVLPGNGPNITGWCRSATNKIWGS